ncbi:tetratricopeptide repeat-containing sulfotransferase family protein [uncultured Shimia sp.]|uniref:tetratricopeptide repeat-containing sulfotransferase family protein n=1 Tax=uncultured Shimia sp. TaxID=573152 RepID=UPI00260BE42B|nr:tetratricopeptide repeat-containing sulfotransferase family protein [uncultured Shimia sp.]
MTQTLQQISEKLTAQLQAGQFSAAAKLAKRAVKKFPREAHFATIAGTALASADQGREAFQYFLKAVKLEPNHEEYQNNLVHAYIVVGRHDKAEALANQLLARRKDPSKLCHLLAFSAELTAQPDKVIAAATRGLDTAREYRANLLVMRGDAYAIQENHDLAEADYQTLLNEVPNHPIATEKLTQLYLDTFRSDLARQTLAAPLKANPDDTHLLIAQADVYLALGQVDEAKITLTRSHQLAPDTIAPLTKLAGIATPDERPSLILDAEKMLTMHAKGTDSWCRLCMALGNLYFAEKDHKAAGKYLAKAKAGLAYLFVHHPENEARAFEDTLQVTPAGPAVLTSALAGRPRPLFVVGQPRSGTTLTEMILSAHPDVTSCGELSAVPRAYRKIQDQGGAFDPALFAETFYKSLPAHAANASAIVDKMPANYRYIGAMLHGIPGAKIIHIERDPREVALSMWRQHFKSEWMRFTNDLRHIALQANLYRRYMNHWASEFEGQFLTIHYQDLVSDVEKYSKDMAAFCDLDWVPEMMAPQKNRAQVRTASVTQVRQGVHKKSVGGWRVMEEQLQPFIRNLDKSLWPELDL